MIEYRNDANELLCPWCDEDARVDGALCPHCMGTRKVVCVRCGSDPAVKYDSGADPVCSTCESTDARNDAA